MANANQQSLNPLLGRQLSSIEFVTDYLQFHFGTPTLTAITHPVIITGDAQYNRGDRDYCNVLLRCIGHTVSLASVVEDEAVRIEFDEGTKVVISLKPNDFRAAEAVIFDESPGVTWIW